MWTLSFLFFLFLFWKRYQLPVMNRPFPSSKNSHFQNEAKCETFVVKMSFICIIIKNHFHINGFALSLALKVRFFGTRKWPIVNVMYCNCLCVRNKIKKKKSFQQMLQHTVYYLSWNKMTTKCATILVSEFCFTAICNKQRTKKLF